MPCSFWSIGVRSRSPSLPTVADQLMARTARSISSGGTPAAKVAPTSAPMLVPATQSTGYVQLLEHPQHADVRRALGAAAAEDQADARPRGGRIGRLLRKNRPGSGDGDCQAQGEPAQRMSQWHGRCSTGQQGRPRRQYSIRGITMVPAEVRSQHET